jgi:hypothetical protein
MNDERWAWWEMAIVAFFVAVVVLACCGCYSKSVHCTTMSAGGEVMFAQEWTEHYLLKPEGWPSGLLMDAVIQKTGRRLPPPEELPFFAPPRKEGT